jgi:hypothetical protein
MRRAALAALLAVLLVGAFGVAKLLFHDRVAVTAVATPPPKITAEPLTLDPGQRACQREVPVEPSTRVVRVYSASPDPDVPRLRVTLRAPGWNASAVSPPGSGRDGVYDTPIAPPPRSVLATVCLESAEDRPAILAASLEDRIRARTPTLVDGQPVEPHLGLLLLEGPARSTISRLRTVLDRAAFFQPPLVGWASVALLLLLVVVVVPGAVVYATLRALRDDDTLP